MSDEQSDLSILLKSLTGNKVRVNGGTDWVDIGSDAQSHTIDVRLWREDVEELNNFLSQWLEQNK